MTYQLNVSYPLPRSAAADTKIAAAAGAEIDASGAGFGLRDLSFYFATAAALVTATEKIEEAAAGWDFPVTVTPDAFEE